MEVVHMMSDGTSGFIVFPKLANSVERTKHLPYKNPRRTIISSSVGDQGEIGKIIGLQGADVVYGGESQGEGFCKETHLFLFHPIVHEHRIYKRPKIESSSFNDVRFHLE